MDINTGALDTLPLAGKTVLVTGSARRLGLSFALACARAGADVVIHHGHSPEAAVEAGRAIEALGRRAIVLGADLADPDAAPRLIARAAAWRPLYGLVNSAAIFGGGSFAETSLSGWQQHLQVNLTAPFLLSQAFAAALPSGQPGRIVNILDWRALRPTADHLAYTISKAALASLTRSMAQALAPEITVNGLALGAVLPPSDGGDTDKITEKIPARRWARVDEAEQALIFLLSGPAYITGDIIYVDGGRHLV